MADEERWSKLIAEEVTAVPTGDEPQADVEPDGDAEPEPMPEAASGPAALLRGTARGLEMLLDASAPVEAIASMLTTRLEEAPAFFRGSDVRIAVAGGPLLPGCLARLDELASRFDLRIIEVAAARLAQAERDAVPTPNLAAGSAPTGFEEEDPTNSAASAVVDALADAPESSAEPVMLAETDLTELLEVVAEPVSFDEPTQTAVPLRLAPSSEIDLATVTNGTRLVVGPVRSGVILEHAGHLVVFGDVNPGAEVRAKGNIIVLGRLRGTAHAGIGQDVGFILSLRLEPQQLRIGRMVTRAADSDTPPSEAEIAYGTGGNIVVERFAGKLPRNLATSL